MDMADPSRGEIWLADLGTGRGHEQIGQRPVLVVSDDAFNAGLAGLVLTVPLTSKVAKSKHIPAHIREVEKWSIPAAFTKPILPSPRHMRAQIIEAQPDGYPDLSLALSLIDCDRPEDE